MNKQKFEIIKLAKGIEYFESFGYEINPNITASKLKEYRFSLSKQINSESISENNKKFRLLTLEESFDTIRKVLNDRTNKVKKIKNAKNWLKNRNLEIEEKRKEQQEKQEEYQIVEQQEVDIIQNSEILPNDGVIIENADLKHYETALENVGDEIVRGEGKVISLGTDVEEVKEVISLETDIEEVEEVISLETDIEEVEEVISLETDVEEGAELISLETDVEESEEKISTELSNRKTSYSFNRQNSKSLVQIIEIENDSMELAIDDTELVFSRLEDDYVSTYIILEESNDGKIKEIDYLYGQIDFEWLITSDDAKTYVESVLNRKMLDKSIRKYCGILPKFLINGLGESLAKWDRNIVTKISEKILSNAYKGKQEEQKEKYVFGKKFMEYATRNLEKTEIEEKRIVFFKSGVIIYDGVICNRYSYYMENADNNGKRELHSFIVTNIDEEKLNTDPIYKQNFINSICVSKKLEKINKQRYSYLGNIKSDGTLVDNLRVSKNFSKLNIESARELDK